MLDHSVHWPCAYGHLQASSAAARIWAFILGIAWHAVGLQPILSEAVLRMTTGLHHSRTGVHHRALRSDANTNLQSGPQVL